MKATGECEAACKTGKESWRGVQFEVVEQEKTAHDEETQQNDATERQRGFLRVLSLDNYKHCPAASRTDPQTGLSPFHFSDSFSATNQLNTGSQK